jgi:hypothetical protein
MVDGKVGSPYFSCLTHQLQEGILGFVNLVAEHEIHAFTDQLGLGGSQFPGQGFKFFILRLHQMDLNSDHEKPPEAYINIHIIHIFQIFVNDSSKRLGSNFRDG